MNRDELYDNWGMNVRYEIFLRKKCGPARYKLLWEVREFLQTFFRIEIDDIAVGSSLLNSLIDEQYQVFEVYNMFEEIKHSYFHAYEELSILTEIYYLIVFAEVSKYNLESFKFTLKFGLKKILKDLSLLSEDNKGFMITYGEFAEDIINEFSELFIQLQT